MKAFSVSLVVIALLMAGAMAESSKKAPPPAQKKPAAPPPKKPASSAKSPVLPGFSKPVVDKNKATPDPYCETATASFNGPEKDVRKAICQFIVYYTNATENQPDGRFKALFPSIEATRSKNPGYTTCVDFGANTYTHGSAVSGVKFIKNKLPNVNFFNEQLRKQQLKGIDTAKAFFSFRKKNDTKFGKDKTCTDVDPEQDRTTRPKIGDAVLLAFTGGTLKVGGKDVPRAGMFSHFAVVKEVRPKPDPSNPDLEHWVVVQGGSGSAKQHSESVSESKLIVNLKTLRNQAKVANQEGADRHIQGFISITPLLDLASVPPKL